MTAPRKQPVPFGKYLLLDRINVGGMAEVWRGKSAGGIERFVAVKRILPNIAEDEEFIQMFMDEARISVQLAHSNIAQIYDFSFEKVHSSYFIAMEYIAGRDMRAVFDKCRKLGLKTPIPVACYIVAKVCDGLDYAHNKKDSSGRDLNIVHRDVSPQNVLISYEGDVKIIDFGVAKAAGKATRTQAGILKGKFGYMSPEQVRAQKIDRRSDIFALGICLYELLTGERLFTGDSDFSVLDKVRGGDIAPPSSLNNSVPEALEKIVLKALSRDVDVRYQNASELAEDLQRFLIAQSPLFGRKDLAAFMKATFPEDVEKERAKVAEYADVMNPYPSAMGTPSPVRTSTPSAIPPFVEGTQPIAPSPDAMGTASAPSLPPPARVSRPSVPRATGTGERTHLEGGPDGETVPPAWDTDESPSGSKSGQAEATVIDGTVKAATGERSVASGIAVMEPPPDARNTAARSALSAPTGPNPDAQRPSPKELWRALLDRWENLPEVRIPPIDGKIAALGGAAAVVLLVLLVAFAVSGHRGGGAFVCVEVAASVQHKHARVRVNNADLGAPSTWPYCAPVSPGSTVVDVSAEGYRPYQISVDVKAGQGPAVVNADLLAVNTPARLVIATTPPDAEIRVDRRVVRPAGTKGAFVGDVPIGQDALVEVSATGYKSFSRTLHAIDPDDAQVLRAELEPIHDEFMIRITSRPAGALVAYQGQVVGRTPVSFKTTGGAVTLRQRCYAERQENIPMPEHPNSPAAMHVELRRLSSCR